MLIVPNKNILLFSFNTILLLQSFYSCSSKRQVVSPKIDDYRILISPDGGEYTFPQGIIMNVPPGAVKRDTAIVLNHVDSLDMLPYLNRRGISLDNILACVKGSPDSIVFNYPVKIILEVDLNPGEIPVVHNVDLNNGSYKPEETEILCNPGQNTISVSLKHFSVIAVEKLKEYNELSEECQAKPCRCAVYEVKQSDIDYQCSKGNCQITESKFTISFPACEASPPEEFFIREVGDGCIPALQLMAASQIIPPGEQTRVSAHLELGCEPIEGQSVDFSLSGSVPATLNPTYGNTNSAGDAYTVFTAGDQEGSVTVTVRSTVSYYDYTISASAGELHEISHGLLITKELNQSVVILIKDAEIKGTITFEAIMFLDGGLILQPTYSNPLPFIINENDSIIGVGYLTCKLWENFGVGGIDLFSEGQTILSGTCENDTLYFNSPKQESGSGYFNMWMFDNGSQVSIIDVVYDDPETTLSLMGIPIMHHTIANEGDEKFAFKLPKQDGAESKLIFQDEESKIVITLSLDLY